jgi:hypothetical protein
VPNIKGDASPPDDTRAEPLAAERLNDAERGFCWVCGAPVNERHCKIICPRCGFMRDCSDP